MLTIGITIAFCGAAILLATTMLNVLTAPMLRKRYPVAARPLVSILIPARNEAHHIASCLEGLVAQTYTNIEILVLDDQSTDETAAVTRRIAVAHPQVRLLAGAPLPPGWTGKNWACDQLSRQADGDFLIFTDADTRHTPRAVGNTLGFMHRHRLDMLSAFPQQLTVSFVEKLVIPAIEIFVYAMLPLWLTLRTQSSLFAAANGQWMAFSRSGYQRVGGHRSVRGEVVEDVSLSRRMKRKGGRLLVTAGTEAVYCRMYATPGEVWAGFSKNLFGITDYRLPVFWSVFAFLLMSCIAPYLLLAVPGAAPAASLIVAMNISVRVLLSMRYKHPFLVSILLHPIGIAVLMAIACNSLRHVRRGKVRWKGREIEVAR